MANMTASSLSNSQHKFLRSDLIKRSAMNLVAGSMCEKDKMERGAGLTAYLVRFNRMYVPQVTTTEGTPPTPNTFTTTSVTVTMDQWSDAIRVTDVAELTTHHPVMQEAMKILADNSARVIDREIQAVWLANTNIQYGDGTATARASLTNSSSRDYLTDTVIGLARVTMERAGVNGRSGPVKQDAKQEKATPGAFTGNFVGLIDPGVHEYMMSTGTAYGTWVAAATYGNQKALYGSEVGMWRNIRWCVSNFLVRYAGLGNTTTAVSSTNSFGTNTPTVTAVDGGGSLTSGATYYFKVTARSKYRGWEEEISIEHTMAAAATGNNESFTFYFDAGNCSSDYEYRVYLGSATGDSNLKLQSSGASGSSGWASAGDTITVASVGSSTTTAPANPPVISSAFKTVYNTFIIGAEACALLTFQDYQVFVVDKPDSVNLAMQYKTISYKFMQKAVMLDATRLLKIEHLCPF